MGFLSNIFNKKISYKKTDEAVLPNAYCLQLIELHSFLLELLSKEKYVAKSEYINHLKTYESVAEFFKYLRYGGMLQSFCIQNKILVSDVELTMEKYAHIEDYVNQHNEEFINNAIYHEKDYLDNILKSVDSQITLDED